MFVFIGKNVLRQAVAGSFTKSKAKWDTIREIAPSAMFYYIQLLSDGSRIETTACTLISQTFRLEALAAWDKQGEGHNGPGPQFFLTMPNTHIERVLKKAGKKDEIFLDVENPAAPVWYVGTFDALRSGNWKHMEPAQLKPNYEPVQIRKSFKKSAEATEAILNNGNYETFTFSAQAIQGLAELAEAMTAEDSVGGELDSCGTFLTVVRRKYQDTDGAKTINPTLAVFHNRNTVCANPARADLRLIGFLAGVKVTQDRDCHTNHRERFKEAVSTLKNKLEKFWKGVA